MNVLDRATTHRDAWSFLIEILSPDIAFVQEAVVPPDVEDRYQWLWASAGPKERWGSAVLSRVGALERSWEDYSGGAVLVARCSIPAVAPFSLASIHARVINRRVIPTLRRTFDTIRPLLGPRFIIGGDLNTARAAALAWPRNGHGEFWSDVEAWGFKEPLPLGDGEKQSYWREWHRNKPPTIGNSLQDDHVLLDAETFQHVSRCRVWDTRRVRGLSDHGPVVVDLTLETESR